VFARGYGKKSSVETAQRENKESIVNIENVKEKITKLLALAGSPVEAEAALAAAKAQELLDKYNLSMADVETADRKTEDKIGKKVTTEKSELQEYDIKLFCRLADLFDSFGYINNNWILSDRTGKQEKRQSLGVIGHKGDMEVMLYTYEYLMGAVLRLYKEELKKEKTRQKEEYGHKMTWNETWKFRLGFCDGCVCRVLERMKQERETRLQADVKCTALVRVRKANVTKWVGDNMKMGKSKARGRTKDWGARKKGYERGSEIGLHKAVKGGGDKRQLN